MARTTRVIVCGVFALCTLVGCEDDRGAIELATATTSMTTGTTGTTGTTSTTSTTISTTISGEPESMSSEGSTESTSTAQPSTPNGAIDSYYEAGDIDHGLDPFIRRATQDLAERLSVPPAEIATVAAVLVVWPDSSSGCPEPGGSYLTALQDGSVIELIAADRVYRYHSGGASGPSLCDQPLSSDPLSSDPLSSDPAAAG